MASSILALKWSSVIKNPSLKKFSYVFWKVSRKSFQLPKALRFNQTDVQKIRQEI
jgi:hypothetical protein